MWNEQGDSREFFIAPAYWQSNWFRTACVLAFAGLLWLLYWLRLRHISGATGRSGWRRALPRELALPGISMTRSYRASKACCCSSRRFGICS